MTRFGFECFFRLKQRLNSQRRFSKSVLKNRAAENRKFSATFERPESLVATKGLHKIKPTILCTLVDRIKGGVGTFVDIEAGAIVLAL